MTDRTASARVARYRQRRQDAGGSRLDVLLNADAMALLTTLCAEFQAPPSRVIATALRQMADQCGLGDAPPPPI